MINRIFFITENMNTSGSMLPPEENVYYSILVDPLEKGSLENAYAFFSQSALPPASLTINLRKPLPEESLRFITSFLFIPAYHRIGNDPVINLLGGNQEQLQQTASRLAGYLSSQGVLSCSINELLPPGEPATPENNQLFRDEHTLIQYYENLLHCDIYVKTNVFFYTSSKEACQSAFNSLQLAEMNFKEQSPAIYSLIRQNNQLEKELQSLHSLHAATATELKNQQQYVEILRSDHATKEIQDYYTNEYEILPLWYKRFGHVLKVLTGKRTFRSLYRDDVKKYNG
jgi:hypothetical protein